MSCEATFSPADEDERHLHGLSENPRTFVIAGAAVIATAVVATSGIGQAAATDGPVLYLNTHGAPTDCDVKVEGTLADGSPYSGKIHRRSCDGTLWMPQLRTDTKLYVDIEAFQPNIHFLTHEFTVKDERDDTKDDIDNTTAVCFLVKSFGDIRYTNMSVQGGRCNGS